MPEQKIRFSGREDTFKIVTVHGKHYVYVCDVQKIFPQIHFLFLNGQLVPLVKNKNGIPLQPHRVEAHPNDTLNGNENLSAPTRQHSRSPSRSATTASRGTHHDAKPQVRASNPILHPATATQPDPMGQIQMRLDEILRNTQDLSNTQAFILDQLSVILTGMYELSEHTIPRHFIIFPKNRFILDPHRIFENQFRLFFICDGTDEEGLHFIFTIHKGYNIKQPKAFFERYATYIRGMIRFVQIALIASNCIVPGIGTIAPYLQIPSVLTSGACQSFIKDALDPMMKLLQSGILNPDNSINTLPPPNVHRSVDGPDLRELEAYLEIKDPTHKLGGLTRNVSKDTGHVSWLCSDCCRRANEN
jgi:hypothetical protein